MILEKPIDITKTYQLDYEVRPEYLFVRVSGNEHDYNIALSYWKEVIGLRDSIGRERVMVKKEIPQALSNSEIFELGVELSSGGLLRTKLAYCDEWADSELMAFNDLVLRNRGVNAKYFDDCESAEKWLIGH